LPQVYLYPWWTTDRSRSDTGSNEGGADARVSRRLRAHYTNAVEKVEEEGPVEW